MVPMLQSSGATTFGGDVTTFAGQNVEFKIELINVNAPNQFTYPMVLIDSIAFSSEPIPEPSTFVLLGTAVASLLAFTWARRRV